MEFLLSNFMGHPTWMWLSFLGVVGVLLALDLGVLHKGERLMFFTRCEEIGRAHV